MIATAFRTLLPLKKPNILVMLLLVAGQAFSEPAAVDQQPGEEHLLILRNDHSVVGILPRLGGNIVVLRRPGGTNFLKAAPARWADTPENQVTPDAFTKWSPLGGIYVWINPQSQWWARQTLNPGRLKAKSPWPPDPYLIYSTYEVLKRTDQEILLKGPASPVSGIRFEKHVTLEPDGKVTLKATMTNTAEGSVSWGLWINAFMKSEIKCPIPVPNTGYIKVDRAAPDGARGLDFSVTNGVFHLPENPSQGPPISAKAFFRPAASELSLSLGDERLNLFLDPKQMHDVHPEHAPLEIYWNAGQEDRQIELEQQGPTVTLAPGESASLQQSWKFVP